MKTVYLDSFTELEQQAIRLNGHTVADMVLFRCPDGVTVTLAGFVTRAGEDAITEGDFISWCSANELYAKGQAPAQGDAVEYAKPEPGPRHA